MLLNILTRLPGSPFSLFLYQVLTSTKLSTVLFRPYTGFGFSYHLVGAVVLLFP